MKKTKINLLVNREDYRKVEIFFFSLRIIVGILTIISLALITYFTLIFSQQNNQINSLIQQKTTLLQSLKNKKDKEAKYLYTEKKYQALKEFMKNDAQSLPYYNLLNLTLTESTQAGKLTSFQINKNREFEFTLTFDDFSQLMNSFKFIESKNFLKNFENIILKSFNTETQIYEKENYQLSFTGRFIQINETKN